MSDDLKAEIARRPVLAALSALVGIGAVGAVVYETSHLAGSRLPKGTYDDLISRLPDRDDAVTVGKAVLAGSRDFRVAQTAQDLRQKLDGQALAAVLAQDMVQGRVVETSGWVLPETLAALCALAAKAA